MTDDEPEDEFECGKPCEPPAFRQWRMEMENRIEDPCSHARTVIITDHGVVYCYCGNCGAVLGAKLTDKIVTNKTRDEKNLDKLKALGWDCLVVWECQLKGTELLQQLIRKFLG